MAKRWILYLVSLIGCAVFFVAYHGWVAWVLMLTVALLPLLSLVLSIGPMLSLRPTIDCPVFLTVGSPETVDVTVHSSLPMPPCRCQFRVHHSMTGQTELCKAGEALPTEHCGQITCHSTGFYVYDYLNMFRLRLRRLPDRQILVRPEPIAVKVPKTLDRYMAQSWKPKYGGGFAEQHELRLYRPGDGMNQIHWKLTAKTGKLIIREPMVPRQGRAMLTMDLNGHPNQIDRKLGKLLFMGNHLLELGLEYEIHVLTGSGALTLPIRCERDLAAAIDTLLRSKPSTGGTIRDSNAVASWRYHIGGERE